MRITDMMRSLEAELGRAPRIGFVGVGKSTLSLLNAMPPLRVSLRSDSKICATLPRGIEGYEIHEGASYLDGIYEDILFLSPSVRRDNPTLVDAVRRGTRLSSDAELFFEDCNIPIYAVSGSDGKSTTSTLAWRLLSQKHPDVGLVGNIGKPFADIGNAKRAVAELSSFQLNYFRPSIRAALITGITPNHLNWHSSFDEYALAKLKLLTAAERSVISPDTSRTKAAAEASRHSAVYSILYSERELRKAYSADEYFCIENGYIKRNGEPLIAVADCMRKERHNLHNLMGAMALTWGEYSSEHLLSVAGSFRGLEHRCEIFHTWCGVDFINSSIDTTPARTRATLSSLGRRVRIILGGRSKGVPLGECLPVLSEYAERISLYGEAAEEYFEAIISGGASTVNCARFDKFDAAVDYATEGISKGDTVLLSPAATGYGEFASFAERGRHFKDYIVNKYPRTMDA